MYTKKITIAILSILVAGGAIFYACKKDSIVSENTTSGITKNQKDIPVGQLHNEILDAYLSALEANPETNGMDFIFDYLGIDKDKFNEFVMELTVELSKYPSTDEWFNNLEEKGIFSSNCLSALREVELFCLSGQHSVLEVQQFKEDIFNEYNFENENEGVLVGRTLSILEYSTQYWIEEDRISKWGFFRHYDPITGETQTNPPCRSLSELMAYLSGMHTALFFASNSSLLDFLAYGRAITYAICVNSNLEGNLTPLGYSAPHDWAVGISAMASGW